MSIAKLKQTAEALTAKERAWLRAYLFAEERSSDPAWKLEMARRRRGLASGRGVAQSTVRRPANSATRKSA